MNITHQNEQQVQVDRLINYFYHEVYGQILSTPNIDAAIILLAQVKAESGDNRLRNKLLEAYNNNIKTVELDVECKSLNMYHIHKNLEAGFKVLESIKLKEVSPRILVEAIYNKLIKRWNNYGNPVTPRWLADFMIKLGKVNEDAIVVDISSSCGVILTNMLENYPQANTISISGNNENGIWSELISYILRESSRSVEVYDITMEGIQHIEITSNTTHVITAPFLGRCNMTEYYYPIIKSSKSDDVLLQYALQIVKENGRVVMLVSDGFLFEQGPRQIIRQELMNKYKIVAIIGLNNGVVSTESNIKTNIIVIDKIAGEKNSIFFSMINKPFDEDYFNCEDNNLLKDILVEYRRWDVDKRAYKLLNSCIVPVDKVDVENMVVNRYIPDLMEGDEFRSPYELVKLENIVEKMKNGKIFKIDPEGKVKVIGSPSVRKMKILEVDTRYSNRLPANPFKTNKDDVLMNSIGDQIGQAALVDYEHSGIYVGQNAILLTPDKGKVHPEYLAIVLNSSYVNKQIKEVSGGTIYKTISCNKIRGINIPLPDRETQQAIIEKYNAMKDYCDRKQREYEGAKEELERFVDKMDL